MKLFLLSQDENSGYDTYDSAVVAAKNAEEARYIYPGSFHKDRLWWMPNDRGHMSMAVGAWAMPQQVIVEHIGNAKQGTPAGVICASFNAG